LTDTETQVLTVEPLGSWAKKPSCEFDFMLEGVELADVEVDGAIHWNVVPGADFHDLGPEDDDMYLVELPDGSVITSYDVAGEYDS
jgi:hypothetical protein